MAGSRWDELERAIRAKDSDAAERVWLELIEHDPANVEGFLKGADGIAERAGGRRQAGVLLWMVAGALKDKGRDRELVRLYSRLSKIAPDDGTLRQALTDAVRRGYAGRADVEQLLERSGVVNGVPTDLAKQAESLERYLKLEPGAYVYHRTGWGIGRIAEYLPDQGRCVIDFVGKRGHGMDILAAADLLERLPEDDLRVMIAFRTEEMKDAAKKSPLDVLKRSLVLLGGDAPLRHVKDMLVPAVVAKTEWASWWKEAKKAATLDPAFTIGAGADPRISYVAGGSADFVSVMNRQLSFAKDRTGRQAVVREFAKTAGTDPAAKTALGAVARAELGRVAPTDAPGRISWTVLLSQVEGQDPTQALVPSFAEASDPGGVLRSIEADDARALAARACLVARPADGPEILLRLALAQDVVVADVLADHAMSARRPDLLAQLLDPVFADPTTRPLLYSWAVRGLIRLRWPGRSADAYKVGQQVLRVLDATAFRAKREASASDQRAVDSLADLLADRNCRLIADGAAATDDEGARHILRMLDRNLGLKPRLKEKLTDTVLRAHPTALRQEAKGAEARPASRSEEVYMTAAGIEKLRREHDRIVHEDMPQNQAEIARAREFGDLSENAEYHAAREKQAHLIARSTALQNLIALAREIRPEIVRTDAVSVGTRVRLRDAAGQDVTYSLLGPADVDVDRNVINYQTPLGQSLMGRKKGEVVTLDLLGQVHTYQVLDITSAV
jgi:transcription elongation factor GreA